MHSIEWQLFKHISVLTMLSVSGAAFADRVTTDLMQNAGSVWQVTDTDQWQFADNVIEGASEIFDGDKTDPSASTFMVSRQVFGGDVAVTLDVSFEIGRYIGVYLDFVQETQSGIWMATGHALAPDAADNEIERGYIKTVEDSFWVVRANGELRVERDKLVRLRFARKDDDYQLFHDGRLVAIYHKPGGYPAGQIQIRLTNAKARIYRVEVESDWVK